MRNMTAFHLSSLRVGILIAAGAGVLAACSSESNERLGVGQERLSSFRTNAEPASIPADDAPSPGVADRSGWESVAIVVPMDATAHQPSYRLPPFGADEALNARQRGAYPDHASCLETAGNPGARAAEGVVAPLQAAGEIVLFPFASIFGSPPWARAASPALAYERSRQPGKAQ